MDFRERIVRDPEIRSGQPCVRGTRTTVTDVFDYLAGGMSVEEVLEEFSWLKREDILACFSYAAERERRWSTLTPRAPGQPPAPNEVAF